MEITVNGESQLITENGATISRLLELRKVESPDMVAVQLNGQFVEINSYPTTELSQGDDVEFLFFMGGGSR
jgi:sulfur carrier protein